MKTRLLGVLVSLCFFASCASEVNGGGNSASGSIGVTRDDALLYAADPDLDTVFVVDATNDSKLAEIKVGRQPEKVLVAPNDTIYVANRMDRSVSVIRRGETSESARIPVAVEPVGLAISADTKTLYVVNAAMLDETEVGSLMAIDTATNEIRWELPVGHEPRGVAILSNNRAVVTLFRDGDVVLVDLAAQKVLKAGTDVFTKLNASALGVTTPGGDKFSPPPAFPPGVGLRTSHARGTDAVVPSSDGKQFYVASLISTDTTLQGRTTELPGSDPSQPNDFPDTKSGGGGGYSGGSCGTSAVAAPSLLTFDEQANPQVEDVNNCIGDLAGGDRPTMFLTSNVEGSPVQGPSAISLDPTGSFLFIANRNSNNVAVVPSATRAPSSTGNDFVDSRSSIFPSRSGTVQELVDVGAGPSGIAVSNQGSKAWVYNAFDHSISRLERRDGRVTNVNTVTLGRDVLSADAVLGRKLFFSAVDARMNNPGGTGIACATCHLEGREDGHVWNTEEGPRQTPSLAGRLTEKTAPFHWNGEFPDLLAFMTHTVTQRMGGSGVSPTMEKQVAAFLATLPKPDTAVAERIAPEALARGRAAFVKAECHTCHSNEALTDNKFANVGTFVTSGAVVDEPSLIQKGLNTPSLLGVSRSSPYLHDGSAPTLRARIVQGKGGDKHGKTAQLSSGEVDDLVLYLKTL